MDSIYLLVFAFFSIAFLYSSVGFGGGSSYLVLLALFAVSVPFIRTTALLCNIAVVSGNVLIFHRKGLMDYRKFLPFVALSVPLAYLGARFKLSEPIFFIILGFSLIVASFFLVFQSMLQPKDKVIKSYPKHFGALTGGAIGFLAGLVGIGGGIFLSPILNLLKWEKPVKIAALASLFIIVNSIAGLVGLYAADNFEFDLNQGGILIVAVILGGQLGLRSSLHWLRANSIRIITGILIFVVAVRILIKYL
ncbi:MAG: sulfite exporter TauE/SafE family protein [Flavobacteriaceae bacterium]|nr:sulfite exporter TauE/SafE family protein [Flavobacteriaceae bacterium]